MDGCAEHGESSFPSEAITLNARLVINIHRIGVSHMSTWYPVLFDTTLKWHRAHWSPGLLASGQGIVLLLFEITPQKKELFSDPS